MFQMKIVEMSTLIPMPMPMPKDTHLEWQLIGRKNENAIEPEIQLKTIFGGLFLWTYFANVAQCRKRNL